MQNFSKFYYLVLIMRSVVGRSLSWHRCACTPILRPASRRRHLSSTTAFNTTLNYNASEIIQLANADPQAARAAFWKPMSDYRALMSRLGARHAQLSQRQFAVAMSTETAEERRERQKSFAAFMASLSAERDAEAVAAERARKGMAVGTFRQPTRVAVASARGLDEATLDEMGFCLEQSGHASWDEDASGTYQRDMEELVRRQTGSTHVFCSPRKLRTTERGDGARGGPPVQPPLHGVHNDFGPGFAEELARGLESSAPPRSLQAVTVGLCKQLHAAGVSAEQLRASRVLMVNTWRSIGDSPVRRQPLALVDTRTVAADDVAVIELPAGLSSSYPSRLVYARPSEAHRWFCFPEMRSSEVLLFKQYDSADERSCRMLHTAVHHPETPQDAPPRRSVELRMLCLLAT